MNARNSTPPNGESVTDALDTEQTVLREEVLTHIDTVADELRQSWVKRSQLDNDEIEVAVVRARRRLELVEAMLKEREE